jgi:hypothetical protein
MVTKNSLMFAPGIWATAREHIFSTIHAQSSFFQSSTNLIFQFSFLNTAFPGLPQKKYDHVVLTQNPVRSSMP